MRMRNLTLRLGRVLGAAALAVSLGSAAWAGDPVYPPGSRFGFDPPADMSLSRRFSGFERKEGGATVSVVELPANAFAELVSGFTDANLLSQGFAVEKREEVKIGDNEGMLYTGEQPADPASSAPAIRKWILVVGTPSVTGLIIAQALPDAETEASMRKMVTGVTLRPALTLTQQVDALPFRIADMAGFRPVRVMAGNSILLTSGPKDQMQNLEQPILVLAQAVQQPPSAEQRDGFARAALASNQTMKDFVIERAQSYRSNGVDWHEIVARALDQPTNLPVVVMQTIRFAPDGYLRALGVVRQDQRDGVLAKFRQVVDSVQVK
ncbi:MULTISPECIES: hypothetical protein [Methylobacterium]|jgi:hypothetical protein|uniref:Uncharacterized protein n=2 Tax=Methylobacterium TaxID=407 RepID=A0AAE8L6H2_9HYPH|nr:MULTISPECIES: hypothetical protein [Methylobacterium]APT34392.1 hypothetical protein MCBMB27_05101 [Methylobacterium phyllosphaerae]MBA9064059.1 hypothetical protein [Methylobacterium fujisawaense]MBP29529.1 hypothetical protein [Methylobacterium sp.]MDE4909787.1 hypothetical protein [Methylobacterium sp. 092160098-2]MDH3027475.1 hypothetical protein [Methylobacterium fujisawaense]